LRCKIGKILIENINNGRKLIPDYGSKFEIMLEDLN
jgi:hypothetical protein